MLGAFQFARDFRRILWKDTIWLNLLRAAFGGLVWSVFLWTQGGSDPQMFLLMPLMYPVVVLPVVLFASLLARLGVPFAGLFSLLFSLLIVVGDPFVYVLHKVAPKWVPVKEFGFINFYAIIFVYYDEEAEEEAAEQDEPLPPEYERFLTLVDSDDPDDWRSALRLANEMLDAKRLEGPSEGTVNAYACVLARRLEDYAAAVAYGEQAHKILRQAAAYPRDSVEHGEFIAFLMDLPVVLHRRLYATLTEVHTRLYEQSKDETHKRAAARFARICADIGCESAAA